VYVPAVSVPETTESSAPGLPRSELWLFGVTIFLGAFLLFQVQPVIGKYILPWFGGTPGVWTTCLLFFQCLLLGGYAYAHWLSQLAPRQQAQIHLTLLGIVGVILGGVFLSMIGGLSPIEWLKPDPATAADRPVLGILTLLLVGIGLPYLVLSSTGPLIQAWFARKYEGRSPYRLYALSNVGSLLALITYPFLVEPYTTRGLQVGAWAFGMVGFAVVCGWLARSIRRIPEVGTKSESKSQVKALDLKRQLLWLLLPACGTAQLMATTNKVSQDVAVTPFLWILPLTLYLLSFIIAFDSPRWYSRLVYTLLLVGCWYGTLWVLKKGVDSDILAQVSILNLTLFLGCMVCHGELYKLRPEPVLLTRYFLTISAGGALGGLFVALVAPAIFDGYWEYQLAVWGCGALLAGVCFVDKTRWALNCWVVRVLLLVSWLMVCWAIYRRGNVFVPHVWLLCLRLLFVSCLVTYLLGLLFKAPSGRPKLRLLGLAALGALCSLGDSAMTLELSGYRNLLTNPLVAFAAFLLLSSISFVWSSVRGWEGWRLSAYMPLAVLVAGLGGLLLAQIKKDRDGIDIQSRNFYGVIRIYDNDLTSYNLPGHKSDVTGVAISFDGLSLASTSADGDTRVWNCETSEELWHLNSGGAAVRAMTFSSDNQWLVTGDADGRIRFWDMANGREKKALSALQYPPTSLAFSPDDQWLAAGCEDGKVRLWFIDSGKYAEQPAVDAHPSGAVMLDFLDNTRYVTGGSDGKVHIYTVKGGNPKRTLSAVGPVQALAVGKAGRLAAAGERGVVRIWNTAKGSLQHELAIGQGGINSLAFDSAGTRLVAAGKDGGVSTWQYSSAPAFVGRVNERADGWYRIFTLEGHKGGANAVAFFGAKSWLPKENEDKKLEWVVSGGADSFVRVWDTDNHSRRLINGRITHGIQYSNPEWAELRTSYYSPNSGLGLALDLRRDPGGKQKVGVVGLGTGTTAAYAKDGDQYFFYDINPAVERVAEEEYSYLRDARRRGAKVNVVLGDARLSMEQEEPQGFDVLVLDAFSSDAIPVHLLTLEALQIYERHMDKDGVIAVHISNRHLQLEGVVLRLAKKLEWDAVRIYGGKEDETGEEKHYLYYSEWILLTRNQDFLQLKEIMDNQQTDRSTKPQTLWTDDHVSILPTVESPAWWQRIKGWPSKINHWWRQTQSP